MNKPLKQLTLSLIMFCAITASAADDRYRGADFSATKVLVDESGRQASQIYMSQVGFREELLTNIPVKMVYISNYTQKKTWMIIPSKKLIADMSTMPGHDQSSWTRSTIFDDKPWDPNGSFAYRWRCVLDRLAREDIGDMAEAISGRVKD